MNKRQTLLLDLVLWLSQYLETWADKFNYAARTYITTFLHFFPQLNSLLFPRVPQLIQAEFADLQQLNFLSQK